MFCDLIGLNALLTSTFQVTAFHRHVLVWCHELIELRLFVITDLLTLFPWSGGQKIPHKESGIKYLRCGQAAQTMCLAARRKYRELSLLFTETQAMCICCPFVWKPHFRTGVGNSFSQGPPMRNRDCCGGAAPASWTQFCSVWILSLYKLLVEPTLALWSLWNKNMKNAT